MHWFCGLPCWFSIDENDEFVNARKKQHENWHTNARGQKRNNTEGKVNWVLK